MKQLLIIFCLVVFLADTIFQGVTYAGNSFPHSLAPKTILPSEEKKEYSEELKLATLMSFVKRLQKDVFTVKDPALMTPEEEKILDGYFSIQTVKPPEEERRLVMVKFKGKFMRLIFFKDKESVVENPEINLVGEKNLKQAREDLYFFSSFRKPEGVEQKKEIINSFNALMHLCAGKKFASAVEAEIERHYINKKVYSRDAEKMDHLLRIELRDEEEKRLAEMKKKHKELVRADKVLSDRLVELNKKKELTEAEAEEKARLQSEKRDMPKMEEELKDQMKKTSSLIMKMTLDIKDNEKKIEVISAAEAERLKKEDINYKAELEKIDHIIFVLKSLALRSPAENRDMAMKHRDYLLKTTDLNAAADYYRQFAGMSSEGKFISSVLDDIVKIFSRAGSPYDRKLFGGEIARLKGEIEKEPHDLRRQTLQRYLTLIELLETEIAREEWEDYKRYVKMPQIDEEVVNIFDETLKKRGGASSWFRLFDVLDEAIVRYTMDAAHENGRIAEKLKERKDKLSELLIDERMIDRTHVIEKAKPEDRLIPRSYDFTLSVMRGLLSKQIDFSRMELKVPPKKIFYEGLKVNCRQISCKGFTRRGETEELDFIVIYDRDTASPSKVLYRITQKEITPYTFYLELTEGLKGWDPSGKLEPFPAPMENLIKEMRENALRIGRDNPNDSGEEKNYEILSPAVSGPNQKKEVFQPLTVMGQSPLESITINSKIYALKKMADKRHYDYIWFIPAVLFEKTQYKEFLDMTFKLMSGLDEYDDEVLAGSALSYAMAMDELYKRKIVDGVLEKERSFLSLCAAAVANFRTKTLDGRPVTVDDVEILARNGVLRNFMNPYVIGYPYLDKEAVGYKSPEINDGYFMMVTDYLLDNGDVEKAYMMAHGLARHTRRPANWINAYDIVYRRFSNPGKAAELAQEAVSSIKNLLMQIDREKGRPELFSFIEKECLEVIYSLVDRYEGDNAFALGLFGVLESFLNRSDVVFDSVKTSLKKTVARLEKRGRYDVALPMAQWLAGKTHDTDNWLAFYRILKKRGASSKELDETLQRASMDIYANTFETQTGYKYHFIENYIDILFRWRETHPGEDNAFVLLLFNNLEKFITMHDGEFILNNVNQESLNKLRKVIDSIGGDKSVSGFIPANAFNALYHKLKASKEPLSGKVIKTNKIIDFLRTSKLPEEKAGYKELKDELARIISIMKHKRAGWSLSEKDLFGIEEMARLIIGAKEKLGDIILYEDLSAKWEDVQKSTKDDVMGVFQQLFSLKLYVPEPDEILNTLGGEENFDGLVVFFGTEHYNPLMFWDDGKGIDMNSYRVVKNDDGSIHAVENIETGVQHLYNVNSGVFDRSPFAGGTGSLKTENAMRVAELMKHIGEFMEESAADLRTRIGKQTQLSMLLPVSLEYGDVLTKRDTHWIFINADDPDILATLDNAVRKRADIKSLKIVLLGKRAKEAAALLNIKRRADVFDIVTPADIETLLEPGENFENGIVRWVQKFEPKATERNVGLINSGKPSFKISAVREGEKPRLLEVVPRPPTAEKNEIINMNWVIDLTSIALALRINGKEDLTIADLQKYLPKSLYEMVLADTAVLGIAHNQSAIDFMKEPLPVSNIKKDIMRDVDEAKDILTAA